MRTLLLLFFLSFLIFSCKKDNHTVEDVDGTWVATQVLWDGVDQTAVTEYTFILTAELDYVIIEETDAYSRYQDGGTYELTNDGDVIAFTSQSVHSNTTANIESVDEQNLVLSYTRTYVDISSNSFTKQVKAIFRKQ